MKILCVVRVIRDIEMVKVVHVLFFVLCLRLYLCDDVQL